ncbi:MAG: hypothetical protein NTW11_00210 [Candidatus Staskawiczbacteria bacterium]|nr:hypothetical protein [Candidatus Staskawiczbacteria bacterium]
MEIITATHVVNNNNASCVGWANNAFQGAVGDALLGGGMVGAAAVLRPARTFVNGGSSSATGGAATGGNATGGAGGAGGLGGGGGHGGSGFATATGGAGGAGGSSSSISSSGSSANSTAGVAP